MDEKERELTEKRLDEIAKHMRICILETIVALDRIKENSAGRDFLREVVGSLRARVDLLEAKVEQKEAEVGEILKAKN